MLPMLISVLTEKNTYICTILWKEKRFGEIYRITLEISNGNVASKIHFVLYIHAIVMFITLRA